MRGAIIEFDDLHKLNWLGERAKLSTVKWWGGALKLALIHGAAVVGLVDAYSNSGRSPRVSPNYSRYPSIARKSGETR